MTAPSDTPQPAAGEITALTAPKSELAQTADDLLDEVFHDLEQPTVPEPVSSELVHRPAGPRPAGWGYPEGMALAVAEEPVLTALVVDPPAPKPWLPWVWMLIGGLWGMALVLGVVWRKSGTPAPLTPSPHQAFITYLQQSLAGVPVTRPAAPVAVKPPPTQPLTPPPPPPGTVVPPPPPALPTAPVSAPEPPRPAAPKPRFTLVGTLDMGSNSLALFALGDVTQQINLGKAIGQSGWTLKQVTEDQAVVQRGSKTQSLYVGQSLPE
ncbi:MAG: hypothetical protein IGQ88_00685 [Gloeomargaritaceae cyanobacterium C42_A2020_066]|nr:hypothetical protein [Gloeomargaritaceae cyanobacterium C42_A2020_066]